jgi:hypothetical protein
VLSRCSNAQCKSHCRHNRQKNTLGRPIAIDDSPDLGLRWRQGSGSSMSVARLNALVVLFSLGYSRARAKRVSLVCASVRLTPTSNTPSFDSRDGARGPAGTRSFALSGVVPGPRSRERLRMRDERRLSAGPSLRARWYLSTSRFSSGRRTRRSHCGRGRCRRIRRRARDA